MGVVSKFVLAVSLCVALAATRTSRVGAVPLGPGPPRRLADGRDDFAVNAATDFSSGDAVDVSSVDGTATDSLPSSESSDGGAAAVQAVPDTECASNPCENMAACLLRPIGDVDGLALPSGTSSHEDSMAVRWYCVCPPGFLGHYCSFTNTTYDAAKDSVKDEDKGTSSIDDEMTPCAGDDNPCLHGGECFLSAAAAGFKCECSVEWTGEHCETEDEQVKKEHAMAGEHGRVSSAPFDEDDQGTTQSVLIQDIGANDVDDLGISTTQSALIRDIGASDVVVSTAAGAAASVGSVDTITATATTTATEEGATGVPSDVVGGSPSPSSKGVPQDPFPPSAEDPFPAPDDPFPTHTAKGSETSLPSTAEGPRATHADETPLEQPPTATATATANTQGAGATSSGKTAASAAATVGHGGRQDGSTDPPPGAAVARSPVKKRSKVMK